MIFRVGQLVSVKPEMLGKDERLELLSRPGVTFAEEIRAIGWMMCDDVALIINLHRADGSSVYVVGPHGGGWAPGGMLTIVEAPRGPSC